MEDPLMVNRVEELCSVEKKKNTADFFHNSLVKKLVDSDYVLSTVLTGQKTPLRRFH